ncbi:MAG: hypothetical protein ABSH25_02065 [Syntrophorhabdales bacterium]|jgi:hypothetical protein
MKMKGRGVILFRDVKALENLEEELNTISTSDEVKFECEIEIANGMAEIEIVTGEGQRFTFGSGYIIRWTDDKNQKTKHRRTG